MAYMKRNQITELGFRKIWVISCNEMETAFKTFKTGLEDIGFSVSPSQAEIKTLTDYIEWIYPKLVYSKFTPYKALQYWYVLKSQCKAECGGLWVFMNSHIPLGTMPNEELDKETLVKFRRSYNSVFDYFCTALSFTKTQGEIFKQLALSVPFTLSIIENAENETTLKGVIDVDKRVCYKILEDYSDMDTLETSLIKKNNCIRVLCNMFNMIFNWVVEVNKQQNDLDRQDKLLGELVCRDFKDFKQEYGCENFEDYILNSL